jgi:hypothetical protein
VNLFCSGHAFLRDGRLLVAGGHLSNGEGLDQASLYDPAQDTWTAITPMNHGRWYPTATSLADGGVLVVSGSCPPRGALNNRDPQLWRDGAWNLVAQLPHGNPFELYPRLHLASDRSAVMTGPQVETWSLQAGSPDGHRAASQWPS